jgi:hypothetical protein
MLEDVYDKVAMKKMQVYEWHDRFLDGRARVLRAVGFCDAQGHAHCECSPEGCAVNREIMSKSSME